MTNHDIRRMLGIGMATLSDHLRDYKDPLDPPDRECTFTPIDVGRFMLARHPCIARDRRATAEPGLDWRVNRL